MLTRGMAPFYPSDLLPRNTLIICHRVFVLQVRWNFDKGLIGDEFAGSWRAKNLNFPFLFLLHVVYLFYVRRSFTSGTLSIYSKLVVHSLRFAIPGLEIFRKGPETLRNGYRPFRLLEYNV